MSKVTLAVYFCNIHSGRSAPRRNALTQFLAINSASKAEESQAMLINKGILLLLSFGKNCSLEEFSS